MPSKIKILLLECKEADVQTTQSNLRKDKIDFEINVVKTKAEYLSALDSYLPHVILSNHHIEDMDAGQALELKQKKIPGIPFILLTENVDELFAVKMMKKGAYDYLLKGNIFNLGHIIQLAANESKIISKKKKQENGLLQKTIARNEAFLNAIPDLIFVTNREGLITDFQPSNEVEPIVSPNLFLGKHTSEILPAPISAEISENILSVLNGNPVPVHEYQLTYADGIHDFECRYAAINENEVMGIVRDITLQRQAEQKIIKSNRLYHFLSRFNQMIVYAGDKKMLLKEACKIAVEIGKFRMAWIGIVNSKTLELEPLVFEGAEMGYLSEIKVIADSSVPEGQGPAGLATTRGEIYACNDIEADPKMAPWKLAALKRNYQSLVGIPIKKFGEIIGTFTLYSDTKNFFDEEEISLLGGATQNISFALENLEKEEMQKKAEEELLRSNKQFQNLVENISGVYWVNNLDKRKTVYLSPSYETIWGRKCEDHYNMLTIFIDTIHPEDREKFLAAYENIGIARQASVTYRIVRPEGTVRWISEKANVIIGIDGSLLEFGYAEDITEQKNYELQIKTYNDQLRLLTGHLHSIREEERTRIGREIHDELGQQLTAVKMDVAWISKNNTDKREIISRKLKNIIELLDESNQSVRRILSELRPATLDNFGLPEAMEWHGKQFTSSTNIPVEIIFSAPDLNIPKEIATHIFRIFQESLTNIMRYARATRVSVSLGMANEIIKMDIEDNGVGFNPEKIQSRKTFGILGMRERVRFLDGQFDIESIKEEGTRISISLPCKN